MSAAFRLLHRLLAPCCAAVVALTAAAQAKDPAKIDFPPLPQFKVQSPEVYDLDNGLRVFLLEDPELPLISVRALVRTGSNHEPAGQVGLGEIFGQVQREGGTDSRTGDEIDEFLEARAAFVETGMGGDVGSASMNCLAEDFAEVFEVFVDVLRHPAFAEDKIELARVQMNAEIARRNDNVGGIVGREFSRLIYGPASPLARLTEYATVAAVTRDDLLAWHAKYFHPNNVYLGVVGDFDAAEMKRAVQAALGDWPRGPAFAEPEVPYNERVEPGVYFIEKADVTQANVRMGHLGILHSNPDYFAVEVLNEVLGGGFSGRLMQNVRSKQGLAYSVFGGVGASYLRPGIFRVGLSTKSESMAQAVAALQAEVRRIIAEPPTAEELKQAKEAILNSFVFNYTSLSQILGQQMTFAYYGLPADYLETYRDNIEKVSSKDVARVAGTYIHPDRTVLLVVGKSAEFDKPVSTFGEVREIDITIPAPPDDRPAVERSQSNVETGARIFERMARAVRNGKGGKLDGFRVTYEMTLNMGPRSMNMGQTVSFVLPDKLRQVVTTPDGNQIIVFNGDAGYYSANGVNRPVPRERVVDGLRSMGRDLLVLASNLGHPDLQAVAVGREDVGGTPCDVVSVTFLGAESRLYVDAEGRVVKQSYQGKHPLQGTPGLVEVRYGDHGEVAGRVMPLSHVMSFEGVELAAVTLADAEINPGLDLSQFEIPAEVARAGTDPRVPGTGSH
jgi:predicted Zn-dependent peptidase